MSKPLHPFALFRLSVLGPLASRENFSRGEITTIIRELARKAYSIPGSRRTHISEQTLWRWYYDWKKQSIEGLVPKTRCDFGTTQLNIDVQNALLLYKKDNPARSLNTLIALLEQQGLVTKGTVSRATAHRFLKQHQMSKRILTDKQSIERRSFNAVHAGDIWQGDVLHGPSIQTSSGMRKTYLVSLMDDASRLIVHSAFCFGETALDIEGVLKQGVLKRGLPRKLIIDNGAAYRANSLQSICALLEIRLIYCRPYEPEGKGKLERFHRTFRAQFLGEINADTITGLDDLNARLWAWLDCVYHQRPHAGLENKTPLERWRNDLVHVRQLGFKAAKIEDIFCHRVERTVRKDGTLNWDGRFFETDFELASKKIILIIDPHTKTPLRVESLLGEVVGSVVLLDKVSNLHRKRNRPNNITEPALKQAENAVDLAYQEHQKLFTIPTHSTEEF
jgi:putative transposase